MFINKRAAAEKIKYEAMTPGQKADHDAEKTARINQMERDISDQNAKNKAAYDAKFSK